MTMINLDHVSSSPLPEEVKAEMIDAIQNDYHNPSSQHKAGEHAAGLIASARERISTLINADSPREIVFTSSGTESVNHAVKGAAQANRKKGNHIITSNIEHNSVIQSLRRLKTDDFKVTSLSVDNNGRVNPKDVENAITDKTVLVSIMHGNNEVGSIQPIEEIGRILRRKKILFHTDAVASTGIVPIDVQKLNVDLLSFSSNNFSGPAGIGGLYIRRGTRIFPLIEGGGQENNKRAGTENLIGIIGMGKAAELADIEMDSRIRHMDSLKNTLFNELPNYVDEYIVNTNREYSLPNIVSISLKYIEGESVMLMLDEENIAVSTKSACASGSLRASHVLVSLGLGHADAQGTMVISFGMENTKQDILTFLTTLKEIVVNLRSISPLYRKSRG